MNVVSGPARSWLREAASGLLCCAVLGVLPGCPAAPEEEPAGTLLAEFGELPDFELVDCFGQPFTRADLQGKVWIVNFIFTACRTSCPLLTQDMKVLSKELEDQPGVGFLSITVDPGNDTPDVLKDYAERSGANLERWVWVTGDVREVFDLVTEGFHLPMGDAEDPEPTHSTRLAVVDRRGVVRSYHDHQSDADPKQGVIRDVERLLRDNA